MNEEDLILIERELDVKLPLEYREAALSGKFRGLIYKESKSVICISRAFRCGEFGDVNWPLNLIAFGDDAAGNSYCLDVSSASSRVMFRDHETLEITEESRSFEEWLKTNK